MAKDKFVMLKLSAQRSNCREILINPLCKLDKIILHSTTIWFEINVCFLKARYGWPLTCTHSTCTCQRHQAEQPSLRTYYETTHEQIFIDIQYTCPKKRISLTRCHVVICFATAHGMSESITSWLFWLLTFWPSEPSDLRFPPRLVEADIRSQIWQRQSLSH